MSKIAIAVHGGAGTILKSLMTKELEAEYRHGLESALRTGWKLLEGGADSLSVVEETTCALEDFPLFNAGRGSVFTHDGKQEMDASIMDGTTLRAGAVALVRNVKNPVKLARLVMDRTEHVLLAADGANRFAREMNVQFEDDAYFYTDHRYQQLLKARDEGLVKLDHTGEAPEIMDDAPPALAKPMGTVGAVACDRDGRLAAATSTGGMTNKKFGRMGDTALIGAGTYADDKCAVSCTGHGEFFMLSVTAYDVSARMRYQGLGLAEAAAATLERLTYINGEGGLIAVDGNGSVTMPFNSDGMYRGSATAGVFNIEIYR